MIHPIVKYGDPVLETLSKRIEKFDDEIPKLVCANPEIIHAEGEQREEEGCLSLPGFRAHVARPQYVTVRAQDASGTEFEMRGEGLLARAFCHEIDHLNGTLFIMHLG